MTTSSQVLVDPYRGLHVSVDTFLINNGDVWNIKTSFKVAFSKVPKIKFGPFETIITDQKKFRIDKQKDHSVDFSKGTGGITSTINTTDSILNTLTVLYNATDSIIVNIFMRTFTEIHVRQFYLGNKISLMK